MGKRFVPLFGTLSRTKTLLLAALKVWELKTGLANMPAALRRFELTAEELLSFKAFATSAVSF